MKRLSFSLLTLGALLLSGPAHAQFGTSTRTITTTTQSGPPQTVVGMIARQTTGVPANLGTSTTTITTRTFNAYPPVYPGYGQQTYTYPAPSYSGPIAPPSASWVKPAWITTIPLSGSYTNAYTGYSSPACPPAYTYSAPACAPTYPSYPAYPAYPTYPAYTYQPAPYPAYTPPCASYPAYGSYSTQTQIGGYGLSLGTGGLSVSVGNRGSSTTMTTSGYAGYRR